MNYPISTSAQLRAVLRALRQSRGLSQEQVGQSLGVNQKRIAAIESAPGVTGFDQITRLVSSLGGRLVIEATDDKPAPKPAESKIKKSRKTTAKASTNDTW
jgi:HTH-type transcriptional regulator/antitoxin HipB